MLDGWVDNHAAPPLAPVAAPIFRHKLRAARGSKPARAAKLAGKLLLLRRADDDGAAGGRLSVSL